MNRLLLFFSAFIISTLFILPSSIPAVEPVAMGDITGQIGVKGKGPLTGGTVFFFDADAGPPPSATKYWRVPTYSIRLDSQGRFNAHLPVGNYYMGASQKFSGESLGPPREGDYFFISQDGKGNPRLHTIVQFKPLNLGLLSEATPFRKETLVTEGVTSVAGTVRNREAKPVEGMLVFAYGTPMMFGRPLFVSERTDREGKYLLRLAGGGTYYLSSRANYGGGPPTADQTLGAYARGAGLTVTDGEAKQGIDITVSTVGVPE